MPEIQCETMANSIGCTAIVARSTTASLPLITFPVDFVDFLELFKIDLKIDSNHKVVYLRQQNSIKRSVFLGIRGLFVQQLAPTGGPRPIEFVIVLRSEQSNTTSATNTGYDYQLFSMR